MKTKKEFILYLNSKYGFQSVNTAWSKHAKATKRLYGDYIYHSDREYFNVQFIRWINGEVI